jgi:hypothetical protein
VLVVSHGRPLAAVVFTVSNVRIVEIDVGADPAKLCTYSRPPTRNRPHLQG